ncbi:sulfurtransferase TusA family protein [Lentibacillus sp. N15]|uniref:sulfurtransferase TusA family protein n=1 Tax=Lentibacillus songyuanensis TaxID=3136161 RepID=UPI0031BA676F
MHIKANETLDAKGLACPMPIVRAKKAIAKLQPGQVIEILATDKGSTADMKAWASNTGHQYLGTVADGDVLKHYLRKASEAEAVNESKHKNNIDLSTLQNNLANESISIIDVREPAEFAFSHIPGAINIPLGELDERMKEIDNTRELYIICRTGNRSDLAAQELTKKGFTGVKNVVPGMAKWNGPMETEN